MKAILCFHFKISISFRHTSVVLDIYLHATYIKLCCSLLFVLNPSEQRGLCHTFYVSSTQDSMTSANIYSVILKFYAKTLYFEKDYIAKLSNIFKLLIYAEVFIEHQAVSIDNSFKKMWYKRLFTYFCVCFVYVLITQSCPTLCDPTVCNLPGSSVHGILQERTLKWVVITFSWYLPDPGIKPRSPALQADCLPSEPQRSSQKSGKMLNYQQEVWEDCPGKWTRIAKC